MNCKFCNTSLPDSSNFCSHCGRHQISGQVAVTKTGMSKATALTIVGVVVVISIIGILSFNNTSSPPSPSGSHPQGDLLLQGDKGSTKTSARAYPEPVCKATELDGLIPDSCFSIDPALRQITAKERETLERMQQDAMFIQIALRAFGNNLDGDPATMIRDARSLDRIASDAWRDSLRPDIPESLESVKEEFNLGTFLVHQGAEGILKALLANDRTEVGQHLQQVKWGGDDLVKCNEDARAFVGKLRK